MKDLTILWTTDNVDVFLRMVSMYALNSKKNQWWDKVNLIIWGPSVKLAAENPQVQSELLELMHQGVEIEACKACADDYDLSDRLLKLGVVVRYMGEPLTNYIQSGSKVLTF